MHLFIHLYWYRPMASYFILGVAIAAVRQHLDKPRVTPVKYKVPHASQLSSCLSVSPLLNHTSQELSTLAHSFLTSHSFPHSGFAGFCPCHSPETTPTKIIRDLATLHLSSDLSSWQHLPQLAISSPTPTNACFPGHLCHPPLGPLPSLAIPHRFGFFLGFLKCVPF